MRSRVGLPPPNRNRLLPISIALLSGRNPRIRGFGWGRVGVGGRAAWRSLGPLLDPHPSPQGPHKGEGTERAPCHMRLPCPPRGEALHGLDRQAGSCMPSAHSHRAPPFMTTARIYNPAKTAMQSGTAKTKSWVLDFEQASPKAVEPLMGWTSSSDTRQQVRLRFDSKDEAIAYCERNGIPYRVAQ